MNLGFALIEKVNKIAHYRKGDYLCEVMKNEVGKRKLSMKQVKHFAGFIEKL